VKTTRTLTVQLGDLIAAAFDLAALESVDPREVSRRATLVVTHLLRRARYASPARPRQPSAPGQVPALEGGLK